MQRKRRTPQGYQEDYSSKVSGANPVATAHLLSVARLCKTTMFVVTRGVYLWLTPQAPCYINVIWNPHNFKRVKGLLLHLYAPCS